MKSGINPWQITIYALIAVALLIIHINLSAYAFDDAFIHFRVARNQLDAGSPYFNDGEAIKVSSSSGWVIILTLLLAATRWIGLESSFPLIVSILNATALFLGMWVFVWVIETIVERQLSFPERLLFQVQYLGLLLLSSWGLMETGLALLVAGWGLLLSLQSKPWGIAILALAVSIRLELSVVLGLAFVWLLVQRRFNLFHLLGYAILGMIPLVTYDLYFYHTMIPQSVLAKPVVYSISPVISFFDVLLHSLPSLSITVGSILLFFGIGLISTQLFMLLIGFRIRKTQIGAWALLFGFWALVIAGGYMAGHTLIFDWYRPLYMIPIVVSGAIYYYSPIDSKNTLRIFVYFVFVISTISIMRTLLASVVNPSLLSSEFEAGSRVKTYQHVGAILYEHYSNVALLTSEIGGLGYAFKGEIQDAAGLATPDALVFHPMEVPGQRSSGSLGAIPPQYVQATMPELIVSLDIFAEALRRDDVISSYNQIKVPAYLPEDARLSTSPTIWWSRYLRIYIRKDLPISQEIIALGR